MPREYCPAYDQAINLIVDIIQTASSFMRDETQLRNGLVEVFKEDPLIREIVGENRSI